jgi:hypothetical protein
VHGVDHPALRGLELGRLGRGSGSGESFPLLTRTLLFTTTDRDEWQPPLLHAYDKTSGDLVWEMELPAAVHANPLTHLFAGASTWQWRSAAGKRWIRSSAWPSPASSPSRSSRWESPGRGGLDRPACRRAIPALSLGDDVPEDFVGAAAFGTGAMLPVVVARENSMSTSKGNPERLLVIGAGSVVR